MQNKKINFKSLTITVSLVIVLLIVFYSFVGILISGPVYKKEAEETTAIEKMKVEVKDIENIEKNVFYYVTYTGETKTHYYIFDEKGNKIASREKEDVQVSKVQKLIKKEYPSLVDVPIKITYGIDHPVYLIEKEYEILVLNFNDLTVEYYMKEEE